MAGICGFLERSHAWINRVVSEVGASGEVAVVGLSLKLIRSSRLLAITQRCEITLEDRGSVSFFCNTWSECFAHSANNTLFGVFVLSFWIYS